MGRFDTSEELERDDLNKCPDCGCFFAQTTCPMCGKVCPEEMRAGNRKRVKKRKANPNAGRVTFIEWYHSWWFIVVMLFVMPLIGIVLLATSPHSRKQKTIFIACGAVYLLLTSGLLGGLISRFSGLFAGPPVDTSLSREAYVERCEGVAAEDYYRKAAQYEGDFIKMYLVVDEKLTGEGGSEYETYYRCHSGAVTVLIRDCQQSDALNFLPGDAIWVWGEGAGSYRAYDSYGVQYTAPGIAAAYVEFEETE